MNSVKYAFFFFNIKREETKEKQESDQRVERKRNQQKPFQMIFGSVSTFSFVMKLSLIIISILVFGFYFLC